MTRRALLVVLALAIGGCGSHPSGGGGGGSGGSGGGGSGGGGGGGSGGGGGGGSGGSGGGGGGGSGGGGGGGGSSNPLVPPGTTIGTYIALGDSISDRGGTGPFFYDQLQADLTAKYPGLMYVHAAMGGAITDAYSDGMPFNAPTVKTQIAGLGHSYPGNVLVTLTIGGNDLNAHATAAIGGTDGTIRGEYAAHLDAELGELATAGRLGSGKVYIVLANIYDFTDGKGNFRDVMCGPAVNVQSARDVSVFGAWNGESATAIGKVAHGALYDMHADFMGHGYNNPNAADVWYDRSSCIHPAAKGHDAIRRTIYRIVTGDSLP